MPLMRIYSPVAIHAKLLFSAGDEAIEFLEPILDKDELGHGLGLALFPFHHQESLTVGGNVPIADRIARPVTLLLEKQARFASGKDRSDLNINCP